MSEQDLLYTNETLEDGACPGQSYRSRELGVVGELKESRGHVCTGARVETGRPLAFRRRSDSRKRHLETPGPKGTELIYIFR